MKKGEQSGQSPAAPPQVWLLESQPASSGGQRYLAVVSYGWEPKGRSSWPHSLSVTPCAVLPCVTSEKRVCHLHVFLLAQSRQDGNDSHPMESPRSWKPHVEESLQLMERPRGTVNG